jgi:hypothetical protein
LSLRKLRLLLVIITELLIERAALHPLNVRVILAEQILALLLGIERVTRSLDMIQAHEAFLALGNSLVVAQVL